MPHGAIVGSRSRSPSRWSCRRSGPGQTAGHAVASRAQFAYANHVQDATRSSAPWRRSSPMAGRVKRKTTLQILIFQDILERRIEMRLGRLRSEVNVQRNWLGRFPLTSGGRGGIRFRNLERIQKPAPPAPAYVRTLLAKSREENRRNVLMVRSAHRAIGAQRR